MNASGEDREEHVGVERVCSRLRRAHAVPGYVVSFEKGTAPQMKKGLVSSKPVTFFFFLNWW